MRALLCLVAATAGAAPAPAQQQAAAAASPAVAQRIAGLLATLRGEGDYAAYFSAAFRQAVPRPQFAAVTAQLGATLGQPLAIASVQPVGAWSATVVVRYERGTATIALTVDAAPPHVVTGLRITGTQLAGDDWRKLSADLAALPGRTALGVYRLGDGAPNAGRGAAWRPSNAAGLRLQALGAWRAG
ncbi:hypothetical protein [Sphingomonas aracearum]|uniref:hypothetical protein n=1 Tax=Sphingomonas aracearum TaxID=2283317 RepID=UPI0015EFDF44|nr:hypothetical protein [Sphingomonas aracearum]